MAENSLSPAFVKISYASPWGGHVMTVPSVPVVAGVYAPTGYAFDLRGGAISVEVSDAVKDYVNVIKPFFGTNTAFTEATVFAQATPESAPAPLVSFSLNIAGTGSTSTWQKAVQFTWSFRADDFSLFKVVMLDAPSQNAFDRIVSFSEGDVYDQVRDYVTADETWVASRGGGRPATFLQISKTLNEALRKRYNMT